MQTYFQSSFLLVMCRHLISKDCWQEKGRKAETYNNAVKKIELFELS